MPSSEQAARAVFEFRAEQQAKQKLAQRAAKEAEAKSAAQATSDVTKAALAPAPPGPKPPENKGPQLPQQFIENEAQARFDAAIDADIGFVERLVWFWSNHFCISADKDVAMVGAYEREAIRPHVLGRFAEMLQAVERHPAMLFYLDNIRSMGADSIAGINGDKGLNENLAREILELHTLGVRSGYSQQDVTSFANVLTGWSWVDPGEPEHGGEFVFVKLLHQPGDQVVLGKPYPDSGAAPCSPTSPVIRRPRDILHTSLRVISSPTSRRPRSSTNLPTGSRRPTATSRKSQKRLSPRTSRGLPGGPS
jgi:uncharacterized protein (DUF1800 family)